MKTRLTYLSFFALLLFLPLWFCGNVAAPQTIYTPATPTAQPPQTRLEKWLKKKARTTPNTLDPEEKKRRFERVILWIIGSIAALTILYLLQGKFLLTVIALMIGAGFNWRRISPRRQDDYDSSYFYDDGNDKKISSPANQYTRKSLWQLLLSLLSFFALLPTLSSSSSFLPLFLVISMVFFLILSIVNAVRGVRRKEPLRNWALTPLLILLSLLSLGQFIG